MLCDLVLELRILIKELLELYPFEEEVMSFRVALLCLNVSIRAIEVMAIRVSETGQAGWPEAELADELQYFKGQLITFQAELKPELFEEFSERGQALHDRANLLLEEFLSKRVT